MKMTFTTDTENDHEAMAILWNLAVAADLKRSLAEAGAPSDMVWPLAEHAVFSLAMLMDHGEIIVNGRKYCPRIAFADEDGKLLDGAAEFDFLHEYAAVEQEELEPDENFRIEF